MIKQATYKIDVSKILDLMAEKNISRSRFADELEVNDRTIRNWINLGKEVQYHNLIKMGDVLKVDCTELLYDACYRTSLLKNIKKIFIEDILEQSKKDLPYQLELSIDQTFDFIKPFFNQAISQRKKGYSWTTKSIYKVFEDLDQAMLIHGQEGSGKTTLILQLMGTLLAEARQNYDAPVPVVFYLPSWSIEKDLIENWLVTELNQVYEVPRDISQDLLENGKILPILEDLDRIPLDILSTLKNTPFAHQ